MAPPRRETPDSLTYSRQGDSTLLRPQAAPVDTFVRQAAPLKSPLNDVAESLLSIRPQLDRYLSSKVDEIAHEDKVAAEAKAMVATAKSWDEAIQKGEADAGASPLYKRVYEETLGKINGLNTAQAQLWQDWVSPDNKIRNTQNPEEIAGWFNERRSKMLEGKTPDFVKGLAPALNQVQQQLTQKIIADNVKGIEQANHDALGQLFMDRITAGAAQGLSPQAIAAQLADDAIPHRFAGMQGKEINTIAAKAIIAVATKTGNTNLLNIGYADRPDVKNPGQTLRGVFTVPDFAAAADSARTGILARGNAEENRRMIAEARAEKRVVKDVMAEIVAKKLEDPNYEPPKELLLKGVQADPSFMSHYRTQAEAIRRNEAPRVDPVAFNSLAGNFVDGIRQGKDVTPIISAMAPYMTPTQLISLHQQADRGANSDQSIFKSRAYTLADDSLKAMVDQFGRKFDPVQSAVDVGAARSELFRFASQWERDALKSGSIDPEKMSTVLAEKAKQLGEQLASKPSTLGAPALPAPMQAPGQQTQAPAAPASPNSIGNSINIAPISKEAGTARWPTSKEPWDLPQGLVADVNEINALRKNPFLKSQSGNTLWQAFESKYGPGAVAFFMTNNPNAIAQRLQQWRSLGRSAQ